MQQQVQSNTVQKRPITLVSDNSSYVGEWIGTLRHGYGRQVWPTGEHYEGQFNEDNFGGRGNYYDNNGTYYEGEWKVGKLNGWGMSIDSSGLKYMGEWLNSLKHGWGIQSWADKARYEGEFKLGQRNGFGKYLSAAGGTYNGDWYQNQATGYGIIQYIDGAVLEFIIQIYEGYLVKLQRNGRGVFKCKHGQIYYGEHKNNKRHGYGSQKCHTGITIEALWVNGSPKGNVRGIELDGTCKIGFVNEDDVDIHNIEWHDDDLNIVLKPENWDEFQFPQLDEQQMKPLQ